jgi:uncharacterized repeat protein (TIGR01451 family)
MIKATSLKSTVLLSLITYGLILFPASSSWAAFTLVAEASPDPIKASQLMDVQVSVSTTSQTGTLTLRLLWPAGLNSSPFTTGGGECPGSCGEGEYLSWDLGTLGPNTSVSVGFNENVINSTVNGEFIPLEFDLLEGEAQVATLSLSVEIQSESPLELAIDPLSDPVAPGGLLVYEVVYGNAGSSSSENTELVFPLPVGTQFTSATGDGVFADGSVSWDLGRLEPNAGGRERVTVLVDSLAQNSLLTVDAAMLSGDVALNPWQSRAMAVSRVATESLQLELESNPDPSETGQMADNQITVSNTGGSSTGTLTLRVLWPEELESTPFTSDGTDCSGSCSEGEYLVWDLGVLGPASNVSVSFNETVSNNVSNGSLIPLEIELLEGGLPARNRSHTLIKQDDSPLELTIDPLADPVAPGGTLVYELVYGNAGASYAENAELIFPIPSGTQFSSATGGGLFADGQVTWNLGGLRPNGGGRERVIVQVDTLAEDSLLLVDAASLSGEVALHPRQSQAMAVSRVATESLQLELESNSDPLETAQLIESQITVSNTGDTSTGTLTLRVLWPEELGALPTTTSDGGCTASCSDGEYLTWDLGILGPGGIMSVSFNENVVNGLVDGSLIPLEFELLESGAPARNRSHTHIKHDDSPLELAIDPLSDPVVPSGTLVYEITYGNLGDSYSEGTELVFPLPAGTQFSAATGGGTFADGKISWNLGSLAANSGGRERVTVQVDSLAEGSLLLIDSATLSGDVALRPKQASAMAVSRVATEILQLELEANPDLLGSRQLTDSQITVSNPAGTSTGTLTLRVMWPQELDTTPFITGEHNCGGTCSIGEYLTWDLGELGANSSITVGFNERVRSSAVNGVLIPLEFELLESGIPVRNRSHTLLTQYESPLKLAIDPLSDPVPPGGPLVYEIVYGNAGDSSAENVELIFPLPAGTQFLSATGSSAFADGEVRWSLGSLAANSGGRERVTVLVDALAEGSLLLVDASTILGDVGIHNRQARAMAVSQVATETLQLELEINPGPLASRQVTDAQVTVSNPNGFSTGTLTLRLLWPEELDPTPFIAGTHNCGGTCSPGEYLTWDLGELGANSSIVVGFTESIQSDTANGALIPFEFELLQSGLPARNRSHTLMTQYESPLELAIDPSTDPVVPGGTLVYEIMYGNAGDSNAENVELTLPLPTGTQFLSATGGGEFADGMVYWSLGSLAANSGGRERVTVLVDALDEGSLLTVDASSISGDVGIQSREARAMAVSRVDTELLQLEMTVIPNPVMTTGLVDAQIVVNNPNANGTGSLILKVLWPEELNGTPVVTNAGSCGTSCAIGEYLTWDLGVLGPASNVVVNFNENVRTNIVNGTIIPLEVELIESSLPARNVSQSILVHPFTDKDLDGEADVFDEDDDNPTGGKNFTGWIPWMPEMLMMIRMMMDLQTWKNFRMILTPMMTET